MKGQEKQEHRDGVFHRFGRWPLVPSEGLLKLGESLRQVQEPAGPTVDSELFIVVDQELHRRGCTPREEHRFWGRAGTH